MDQSSESRLNDWNQLEPAAAAEAILPCNGSQAWAAEVAHQRPFGTAAQLFAASDDVWRSLPTSDWQQAFDSHPRIGERKAKAATAQSAAWSAGEQSAAQRDAALSDAIAEANRAYEQRFGRIFLICATGKSAAEILDALNRRIANDPENELLEAAEQQRQITQLRLRKWLGVDSAAPIAV